MKITFIVPVYNVESYLEQCVNSLIASWEEKQILLITGNSTDDSDVLAEYYQMQCADITVIKQNGKGLSNARNCGLKYADGEYVLFIDSDDYVDAYVLRKTLIKLESEAQTDVVASDFFFINEKEKQDKESHQIENENVESYLSASGSIWNVWRYIYRTDFLKENHLTFMENIKSEDVLYTTQVFLHAKRVICMHNPYYCYRVRREGALTTQINGRHVCDFLEIIEKAKQEVVFAEKQRLSKLLRTKIQREYILNLPLLYEVHKEERLWVSKNYKKSGYVLKESGNIAYQVVYIWIKMFNPYLPALVLYGIREFRRKRLWSI